MKKALLLSALAVLGATGAFAQTTELYGVTYDVSNWPIAKVVAPTDPASLPENVIIVDEVEYDGKKYSVNSIAEKAFYETTISSIVIPEGILSIGDQCFANTTSLTNLKFPDSLTEYGKYLFQGSAIENVTYGTGTEELGYGQFTDAPSLKRVTCLATKVPVATVAFFDDAPVTTAVLYVPEASLSDYEAADGWRYFGQKKGLGGSSRPATSISLSDTSITLEPGQSHVLTPIVEPADYTNVLSWITSDKEVAMVENGRVTGVMPGNAIITAMVGTLTATCEVTVTNSVGVDEVNVDSAAPARYYNLQGVEISNPERGQLVIVRHGDKTYKAVM